MPKPSIRPRTAGLLTLLAVALAAVVSSGPPADAGAADPLEWPPVTQQTRPWTRWWWLGNILNRADLTAAMEEYRRAGIGGLEITPIYGVRGYEERFIPYLSPAWMEMLGHTLREGERLGLGIDMATGTGWPFGGPWVEPEDASKYFAHKSYRLRAGERLREPVTIVQRPLVRGAAGRVAISQLREPISANPDLQSLALDQVRFEKPLPLQALMAYSDGGETLNLTSKVGPDGRLDWTAPDGSWKLVALFQGWHGKMVERAGPGGEGLVIDHFSETALADYLRPFDRALAGRDIRSLRAFFNDSYEVDDAAGEANWTSRFFAEFRKRRGYDLRNHLPALVGEASPEENARVLSDYRETLSDLLLDEFTRPWRRWAAGKGAIIRNQAHGSPANILDLYAASDIPETEGAEVVRFKFASSAAHVTGKRLVSAEAATWLDEHFQGTLGEVKQAVDLFFLGGVNHICYHGTPFSPPGEEWPGWLFYASVHFGPTNSFWPDFPALNEYVTRCQSFLQTGRPDNDVLLYYPIHDRWAVRGRRTLEHYHGREGSTAEAAGEAMLRTGYTFDLVSDRQLAGVRSGGRSLRIGGGTYQAIVVPEARTMPLESLEKLVSLAREGATVLFTGDVPSDVPGRHNLETRRAALRKLLAQVRLTPAGDAGVRAAAVGRGRFLTGADLPRLLAHAGVRREPMVEQGLQFVRRRDGAGHHYFILNSGTRPLGVWVPLQVAAKSAAIFDPMSGESGMAALRTSGDGVPEAYLQLPPGASRIVRTFNRVARGPQYAYFKLQALPRGLTGTWTVRFLRGGPELPAPVATERLGSWTNYGGEAVKRFSGTARYTLNFSWPEGEATGGLLDLGRVAESAQVRLNGKVLGTLIQAPYHIAIPRGLLAASNRLEIDVSNLMANRTADLDRRGVRWKKFYNVNFPARLRENAGPDGLFSAARWPPQASGLLGPVTLAPLERLEPR